LPKDKVGRIFSKVLAKIQKGEIDEIYFGHYIEAFASWDMDKLIDIIVKGLKHIQEAMNPASGSAPRTPAKDSPPSKKKKPSDDQVIQMRRPLEFIKVLLASPKCSGQLQSNFGVHLVKFCEILTTIRTAFGELLKTNGWKNIDMRTMISAYETLTILSLIITKNGLEQQMDDSSEEMQTPNDRLVMTEINWFSEIMDAKFPPTQSIKMLLRCINIHLDSGVLSRPVLDHMSQLLDELKVRIEENNAIDSLQEAIESVQAHLDEAKEFCVSQ